MWRQTGSVALSKSVRLWTSFWPVLLGLCAEMQWGKGLAAYYFLLTLVEEDVSCAQLPTPGHRLIPGPFHAQCLLN